MPKPGDKGYLIGNLNRKIALLEGELARAKTRIADLEAEARRKDARIARLEAAIDALDRAGVASDNAVATWVKTLTEEDCAIADASQKAEGDAYAALLEVRREAHGLLNSASAPSSAASKAS